MGTAQRAIAVVKRVVALAGRGAGAERMVLGEQALVKVLHVSTHVARQLSRAPFPPSTPAQRVTMEALAAQLRAAASGILSTEETRDASTLEGALSEAVEETLRLVEIALGVREQELPARHSPIALGAGDRES